MHNDQDSRRHGESRTDKSGSKRMDYETPLLQELGSIRDIVKDITISIIVN